MWYNKILIVIVIVIVLVIIILIVIATLAHDALGERARFMHREAQVEKSFNVLGTVFENFRNVLAAPLVLVSRRFYLHFGGNSLARGARRPKAAVRLLARLSPPKT